MKKQEILKRYIMFIISLFFIGLGISLTKHAEIGISPISSVANVVSLRFTSLSFGNWLIISNIAFLIGQILILRGAFKPIQLLQIPLSFLFGYFTDFGMFISEFLPNDAYIAKLFLVVGGSAVLGFGISLSVIADVLLNSGEAFVKALADTLNKDFGVTKVVFDVCWVGFSILLSLLFFGGKLTGVREGTVISALLVGSFAKWFCRLLKKPLNKLFVAGRNSN